MKRSPLRRTQYRQLRPGEQPPPGEPKRYTSDSRGYVRLRWKVGPASYVETYEHRLAAGLPDAEVHHSNDAKGDNTVGNLTPLSKRDHAALHGQRSAAQSKRETEWDGQRSQAAYDKRQRRLAREAARAAFVADVARRYREGASTTEIGAALGRDASSISRALRASGTHARPRAGNADPSLVTRQLVHARDQGRCVRCGRSVLWRGGHLHHRILRSQGGPHTAANLITLCADCHGWAHHNRADAERGGYILPAMTDGRPTDPEQFPVWLWPWLWQQAILLDNHGQLSLAV